MSPAPLISIVLPVFDDEATLASSLESCLAQTLSEIEIICVDDASTDGTVDVIEAFRARDPRVRLIAHTENLSAFQARRSGIHVAAAAHILFLDGDDELSPEAAERALAAARRTGADLIGFGVTVVEHDGRSGGAYEQRLQPAHRSLDGPQVLDGLFPVDKPAQGQLWRYLFRTSVLREAYGLVDPRLKLARVNDLPLVFLAAALATSYASIPDKLYRYHFGRGGSGHRVDSLERARFYASAITSIDSIRAAVMGIAERRVEPGPLLAAYESTRLSVIGYVSSQFLERGDDDILPEAMTHLRTLATTQDIITACGRFHPSALAKLKFHAEWLGLGDRPVRSILLATSTLRSGGVSAVIRAQARFLTQAGYRVTVVARSKGSDDRELQPGVTFVEMSATGKSARLEEWQRICRTHEIDLVIDHQMLYTRHWPEFALAARAENAATIGWVHSFIGRPIYEGDDRLSLIERCASTVAQIVVLSPTDVAYLKLRGIRHVAYLPNPPSPLLLDAATAPPKHVPSGRVELVWWGRLDQHTKRVYELIEIGTHLKSLGVDFRLTAIGPDWDDVTAAKFKTRAERRGVGREVVAVGPRKGPELLRYIDDAHVFVSTSIIEGYQLTIPEAQSRGLPVAMYELPWLTIAQDNEGVIAVPQEAPRRLAREIADLAGDPERYRRLSDASRAAADRAHEYDFQDLYVRLVTGRLMPSFSPEPTLEDAQRLLGLLVFYAERSAGRKARGPRTTNTGIGIWQLSAPLGREVLKRLPGLRPFAHKAKGWLGAR